jgi:hypothetical protein
MGGVEDLIDQGAVEEAFVQVVAVAVVPQVQAENIETLLEEVSPGVTDVGGFGASFPAVQKEYKARRCPADPA